MSVLLDLISCRIPKAIEDHAHAHHCCLLVQWTIISSERQTFSADTFQQSILDNWQLQILEGSREISVLTKRAYRRLIMPPRGMQQFVVSTLMPNDAFRPRPSGPLCQSRYSESGQFLGQIPVAEAWCWTSQVHSLWWIIEAPAVLQIRKTVFGVIPALKAGQVNGPWLSWWIRCRQYASSAYLHV